MSEKPQEANQLLKAKPPIEKGQKRETGAKPVGRKSLLVDYVDKAVTVITNDGRNILGEMKGFDQVCNVILDKSIERVFAATGELQTITLGLYVIRGDNVAIVGEIDAEKNEKIEWDKINVRFSHCTLRLQYNSIQARSWQRRLTNLSNFILVANLHRFCDYSFR